MLAFVTNIHIYHIVSYHIVEFKWQNCLIMSKPKLKVKMQSVSDDVQKTTS